MTGQRNLCSAAIAGLLIVACGGCASSLRITNAGGAVPGVPFNASVMYIKEFDRNRHSEQGEACTLTHVSVPVALPLGERFYANVDPAQFAKTGFSITFAENGVMTGITLNSEPAGADNVRAVTEAITALAPLAGVAALAVASDAGGDTRPACDAGEANVRYRPFASE
jgi:hypothetical protein